MVKHPSPRTKRTERKAIVTHDVRARLDQDLYAIAYIMVQRQMRQHWAPTAR